jgi:hypothetical protein
LRGNARRQPFRVIRGTGCERLLAKPSISFLDAHTRTHTHLTAPPRARLRKSCALRGCTSRHCSTWKRSCCSVSRELTVTGARPLRARLLLRSAGRGGDSVACTSASQAWKEEACMEGGVCVGGGGAGGEGSACCTHPRRPPPLPPPSPPPRSPPAQSRPAGQHGASRVVDEMDGGRDTFAAHLRVACCQGAGRAPAALRRSSAPHSAPGSNCRASAKSTTPAALPPHCCSPAPPPAAAPRAGPLPAGTAAGQWKSGPCRRRLHKVGVGGAAGVRGWYKRDQSRKVS